VRALSPIAALGSLAVAGLLSIAAARAGCDEPAAPAAVALNVDERPTVYRLAESGAALAVRARATGTAIGHGDRLLGYTVNRYEPAIALETAIAAPGCAVLRSAIVTVAAATEVLADRRFGPGTCQQAAILDHENQHVAVFREAIAQYAPAMAAALRRALPASLVASTRSDADAAYARQIGEVLAPWLDAARARAADGNRRLDAPESYARTFRRCASW